MEYSENSCRSYCPWLDESPTTLRVNDSQRQPQQRVIPKKMKKLIDGDLAAVSGKGRSTKDRLKDKLRRKQESKDRKDLQESHNKDVAVPTEVEPTSSKKKKRRKKAKKVPADKQEHEDKHEDTKQVELNENVEVEESPKEFSGISSGVDDESLSGDTLASLIDKDNVSHKRLQKVTVSEQFGKKIAHKRYGDLVENFHKKLRRNHVVQICMSERKKLIEEMKREIEMEKLTQRKQALGKDEKSYICRMPFTAVLQRLEATRTTLLKHQVINTGPDTATTVDQESSTTGILKSKVFSKGQLSNAVEIPAEYPMKACLSRFEPISTKDFVFTLPSQEKRQKHLIVTCEKMYDFLRSFVPQEPTELNTKPSSLIKNISVFGMKNIQFGSKSPVTYNRIQLAQTMSNALQMQEKKRKLYITLSCSESKHQFTSMMIKAGNIKAIETFLMEAMKLMMNRTSTTGLELVKWTDAPNSVSMVQMGLNQLIIICGDLNLGFLEFLDAMKNYGMTSSLVKQTSTTGLELVEWSGVANSASKVKTGHNKPITICSDLKLDLLEFFDIMKTYGMTSSLMKQRSATGLELVKWSEAPNSASKVQMGHSQLITICDDFKLNLLEFLEVIKNYGSTSSFMSEVSEVIPAQKFSPATIKESVFTKSLPSIIGVTENKRALSSAFKQSWMTDSSDPWGSKNGIESSVRKQEKTFEVAKQCAKIMTKTKMDTKSAFNKRRLINLPSVVVALGSRKGTTALKDDFGEMQIFVDFAELLKYANKIVEQHSLLTKVSTILFSQSQQFNKIEIHKDKLFKLVSNKASTQIGTFGKSAEPSKFKNPKKTNIYRNKISGLVYRDVSKITRQDFRKDTQLDIRKVNDYKNADPDGVSLQHRTSAAYGKTVEKVSYKNRTEKLTQTQKEQRLQHHMCDNDKIGKLETHVALKRQTVAESIKIIDKITATEATRKYISRLHRQMLKNISSEQGAKQQTKLNTLILSRYNVSKKHELLKQKLQKNNTTERMRETKNRTVETVSINHENTTRSQNTDDASRQRDEQSENTNIIDDFEQTHYGIRLCMFD